MFLHLLLTRFNLKNNDWKRNKNNQEVLTPKWLEHRYDLFLNYCFPSVLNQENQNFEWLVFFDKNTPNSYKELNQKLHSELPQFNPIYIENMGVMIPSIQDWIQKSKENNSELTHLLSSRLDNDDLIHKNYIQSIQNAFEPIHNLVLDPVNGLILQSEPKVFLAKKHYPGNPFESLIEEIATAQTVYSHHHGHLPKGGRKKMINERLWLQNIHGQNKLMKFISHGMIKNYNQLTDFGMSKSTIKKLRKPKPLQVFLFDLFFRLKILASKIKKKLKS